MLKHYTIFVGAYVFYTNQTICATVVETVATMDPPRAATATVNLDMPGGMRVAQMIKDGKLTGVSITADAGYTYRDKPSTFEEYIDRMKTQAAELAMTLTGLELKAHVGAPQFTWSIDDANNRFESRLTVETGHSVTPEFKHIEKNKM